MRLVSIIRFMGNLNGGFSILQESGSLTSTLNLAKIGLSHARRPQETALDGTRRIRLRVIHEQFLDHFILTKMILFYQILHKRFGIIKGGNLENIGCQLKTGAGLAGS